jgi:hypothetical protein
VIGGATVCFEAATKEPFYCSSSDVNPSLDTKILEINISPSISEVIPRNM